MDYSEMRNAKQALRKTQATLQLVQLWRSRCGPSNQRTNHNHLSLHSLPAARRGRGRSLRPGPCRSLAARLAIPAATWSAGPSCWPMTKSCTRPHRAPTGAAGSSSAVAAAMTRARNGGREVGVATRRAAPRTRLHSQ